MAEHAAIVGMGMLTAVGLSSVETAASVRAAVMRFTETDIRDKRFEPVTLAEVPEECLPDMPEEFDVTGLTARETRMLRLAVQPLGECLDVLPSGVEPPPLFLALPETETTIPLDGDKFLDKFAELTGGAFDRAASHATDRGRAGGLSAVGRGVQAVASGQVKFALVGGVDSYRDLYVLGTMDMEGRMKSSSNLDGFVPGEASAFLLLTDAQSAGAAGLTPIATVSEVASGVETGHLYSEEPYRGDGLANVVQSLFESGAAAVPVGEVYSSMNGEAHWAKEWGVTYIRNSAWFAEEHGMHHPADCFGDTGAASCALMVGLGALGVREGYRQGPVLVYGSSDTGGRSAAVVSR